MSQSNTNDGKAEAPANPETQTSMDVDDDVPDRYQSDRAPSIASSSQSSGDAPAIAQPAEPAGAKRKIPKKSGSAAKRSRTEDPGEPVDQKMVSALTLQGLETLAPGVEDANIVRKHLLGVYRRIETAFEMTQTTSAQVLALLINVRITAIHSDKLYVHAALLRARLFPKGMIRETPPCSLFDCLGMLQAAASSPADATEASRLLENLRQEDKSLRDYIREFKEIVLRLDSTTTPVAAALRHFTRGLRTDAVRIHASLCQSMPQMLAQWTPSNDNLSELDRQLRAVSSFGEIYESALIEDAKRLPVTAYTTANCSTRPPPTEPAPTAAAAVSQVAAPAAPAGRRPQQPRYCANCPTLNNHTTAQCRRGPKVNANASKLTANCLAAGTSQRSLNLFMPIMMAHLQIKDQQESSEDAQQQVAAPRADLVQPLCVNAWLNDVPTSVILDSGAFVASFVTRDFLINHLHLPQTDVHDSSIQLILAENTKRPTYGWSPPIHIQIGRQHHITKFIIVDELLGSTIVLGLPDLTQMGLLTFHLPNPLTEQERDSHTHADSRLHLVARDEDEYREEDPSWSSRRNLSDPDLEPESLFAQELRRIIQPLIDENQTFQGFAKFPPVRLRMKNPGGPVYRKQYKIPYAASNAVDEQIAKWLSRGKIKIVNSSSNLPLTTAPKVDASGNKTGTRV